MRARPVLAALTVIVLGLSGSGGAAEATHPVRAGAEDARPHAVRVQLLSASGAQVGTVDVGATGERMLMRVRASGLTPGFHGFHVHSVGQCDGSTATPFSSAGGHWNPDGAGHGSHDGDLPALYADAAGTVAVEFATDAFTLDSIRDADGAALIVHAGADNLANVPDRYTVTNADGSRTTGPDTATLATGDAGGRFACGVVPSADSTDGAFDIADNHSRTARAALRTATGAEAGVVRFAPAPDGRVRVSVDAHSLTPGFHGMHVHAVGQCDGSTATPFSSAGGHLGGGAAGHGQHDGDLPPLFVNADGLARVEVVTDAFTLDQVLDADGGALIVHAGRDNLANIPARYSFTAPDGSTGTGPDAATLATGDSGGRVLCGVVVVPPPPAASTLSLDFPVVTAGNSPKLLCRITDASGAGAPDVEVTFFAKTWGTTSYEAIGTAVTGEDGRAELVVRPQQQTAYVARVGEVASPRALVQVHTRIYVTSASAVGGAGIVSHGGHLEPRAGGVAVGLGVYTGSGTSQRYRYLQQTRTSANGSWQLGRPEGFRDGRYVVYVSARRGNLRGSAYLPAGG